MMIQRITEDIKQAMREKQEIRLGTLRMVLSALKNEKIAKQHELSEDEEITVLQREAKKRAEAEAQFRSAGRIDLADKEQSELGIIRAYLPLQMDDSVLETVIRQVIASTGAMSPSDMGKVIGAVMAQVQGKAEGARVSAMVKKMLAE